MVFSPGTPRLWSVAIGLAVNFFLFSRIGFALATDYSSASFIVRDPVTTVEGGQSTAPDFQYFSSTGQTAVGENSSASFSEQTGSSFTSIITTQSSPAPVNTGGGGGTGLPPPSTLGTQIIFSGQAPPGSLVVLLKDGQVATTTIAGPDSQFSIMLPGLSPGTYSFSLYSQDKQGNQSSVLTFPVSLVFGSTTNVKGLVIPAPAITPAKKIIGKVDLNGDGKVNLIDISILLYWYHRPLTDVARKIVDLNGDGKVNLIDFSILIFYWTG